MIDVNQFKHYAGIIRDGKVLWFWCGRVAFRVQVHERGINVGVDWANK